MNNTQIKAGDFFTKSFYNKKYNVYCLLISNKFCLYFTSDLMKLQIKRYDTENHWLRIGFLPIVSILSTKEHQLKIV